MPNNALSVSEHTNLYSNLGTAIGHHTVTEDYPIASESMAVRQSLARTHRYRHIRHHRGRTSHEESLALRHVPNLLLFTASGILHLGDFHAVREFDGK